MELAERGGEEMMVIAPEIQISGDRSYKKRIKIPKCE